MPERSLTESADTWAACPDWVRSLLAETLAPGETPLTWFEPDLDCRLHYAPAVVVLTDRRLLSYQWPGGTRQNGRPAGEPESRHAWTLSPQLELVQRDNTGVGKLELFLAGELISTWRYTAARAAGARRLSDGLSAFQRYGKVGASPVAVRPASLECATCGARFRVGEVSCPECGASIAKSPMMSLLRLFTVARKYLWMGLLGFALTLASTASGLIPPYLTMPLMDDILVPVQGGNIVDLSMVKWYLLGLAGASVLAWGLTWAQMFVMSWVSERVSADLRIKTYTHLQQLSLEYFGGKRTGDLISRVSSDTDRICYFLSVYVLDFLTDILLIVMTAAIMLSIDWELALVTLFPLPFIAYLVFRVQDRMGHGFSLGNRAWAEITTILADTIPGIRVVKAFAQEEREIKRFKKANDRVLNTNDRVNKIWSFFNAVVVLLTDLGVLVVWLFGVYRVFHHSILVGVLTTFVAYISRFYARLDSMSRMVSATQRAAASAQRVFGILDRVPKVAEATNPVHPGRLEGRISIQNVSFRYGTRPILKNLDLAIEPGEMIGLVGQSGAGKTSLINLLCRFYDVSDGAILVDGTDIRRFPIGEYRRCVGLVLQEPFLFYGTIAENIAYGRAGASRAEIIAAARAARAHEFILRLPNGYDSLVGERGQFLSGGERQRVSIARALLIDPRILILDEATSSVDTETEREIQIALSNLIKGRTTIAIAHRLSTLQQANRIVVMERGEIVEVGPHAELLERGEAYARLYRAQLDMQSGRLADEEEDDLEAADEEDVDGAEKTS
ncbi:MAG: ABC transporter ATP-binding protein [Bryobacterales bacterium]|nr:ABC transporter ATP-binding protein [Bryobacterales bacterium]